jgi:hypothetical protein
MQINIYENRLTVVILTAFRDSTGSHLGSLASGRLCEVITQESSSKTELRINKEIQAKMTIDEASYCVHVNVGNGRV